MKESNVKSGRPPREALTDDVRTESRRVIADVAKCLETLEHQSLSEPAR